MNITDFIRKPKLYLPVISWFLLLYLYSYKSWIWYKQYILNLESTFRPQLEYIVIITLIFINYIILAKILHKYCHNKKFLLILLAVVLSSCILIAGSQSFSTDIFMNNLYGSLISQHNQSPYIFAPSCNQEEPFLIYSVWSEYTSPYPPLLNYLHAGASLFINNSVNQLFFVYRLIAIGFITLFFKASSLLSKSKKISTKNLILLVTNPLILIETVGNFHTEIIIATLMIYYFYFQYKNRKVISTLFAFATFNIKYTILVFALPIARTTLQKLNIKIAITIVLSIIVTLALFLPLIKVNQYSLILQKILEQAGQKNITIPFVLDSLLHKKNLYSLIPFLNSERLYLSFNILFLIISSIISIPKIKNTKDIIIKIFWSYFIYLTLIASWIQPWYSIPLITFGLIINNKKYQKLILCTSFGYLLFYGFNLYSRNNFSISANISNILRLTTISVLPLISAFIIFRRDLHKTFLRIVKLKNQSTSIDE